LSPTLCCQQKNSTKKENKSNFHVYNIFKEIIPIHWIANLRKYTPEKSRPFLISFNFLQKYTYFLFMKYFFNKFLKIIKSVDEILAK